MAHLFYKILQMLKIFGTQQNINYLNSIRKIFYFYMVNNIPLLLF